MAQCLGTRFAKAAERHFSWLWKIDSMIWIRAYVRCLLFGSRGQTMTHEPFQLCSLGYSCQLLQVPISKIREAADRLGIRSSSINGVVHFSESDVDLIREALLAELRLRESQVHDQRSGIQ